MLKTEKKYVVITDTYEEEDYYFVVTDDQFKVLDWVFNAFPALANNSEVSLKCLDNKNFIEF